MEHSVPKRNVSISGIQLSIPEKRKYSIAQNRLYKNKQEVLLLRTYFLHVIFKHNFSSNSRFMLTFL